MGRKRHRALLDLWVEKHDTKLSFATEVKQPAQKISCMYAGRRPVPWWMFSALLRDLHMDVEINGYGITLRKQTLENHRFHWHGALRGEFQVYVRLEQTQRPQRPS